MSDPGGDDGEPVGRGKPPRSGRFAAGHRRSRGKRNRRGPEPLPYDAVMGQLVPVTDADRTVRQVTLEEAVLRRLRGLGLAGHLATGEELSKAAAKIRRHAPVSGGDIDYVVLNNWLGSVNDVVLPLQMAQKMDPDSADPLILLEPWLVENALARLPEPLSVEEQRIVWDATLTPRRVKWPDWWTQRRGTGIPRPKRPLVEDGYYPPCVCDEDDEAEN